MILKKSKFVRIKHVQNVMNKNSLGTAMFVEKNTIGKERILLLELLLIYFLNGQKNDSTPLYEFVIDYVIHHRDV